MINNLSGKSAKELREIALIQQEEYRKLLDENESLKAQLEAKNKGPSHWDTAPEGAVKLVRCHDKLYYLNENGEYWNKLLKSWVEDVNSEINTLIDERTL